MDVFSAIFEMIGVVAFAISGALVGIRHKMDLFGVISLGVITALGGGVIRDVILGIVPPAAFQNPTQVLVAAVVSILVFLPFSRRRLARSTVQFDTLLLIADSIGLGIFTVHGLRAAVNAGFSNNLFLLIFVALITGVGGGVLRDLLAGERPYIFVKHIYACASIVGALLCALTAPRCGIQLAMTLGCAAVILLRLSSARYRWNLPKAD